MAKHGGSGNGGNGGKGHGGKGGKGGKGNNNQPDTGGSDPQTLEELTAAAITGGGDLAFGDALSANQDQIKQERSQHDVINRAYDQYATELQNLTAAQQQAVADARASNLGMATALGGIGAAVTDQGVAEAQQRAALLGQGSSVADTTAALGGSSALSRGTAAVIDDRAMADLGLANFSDFARRAATGRRDRIRAQDDRRDKILELKDDRGDLLKQKGEWMSEKLYEYLQQQKENQIAEEGLQLQRRGQKQDAQEAHDQLLLDQQQQAADIANMLFDNQTDRLDLAQSDSGGGNGGNGGGHGQGQDNGGLSPSQREQYQDAVEQVKSAQRRMAELVQSGMSIAEARAHVQHQQSLSEWVVRVATDLVKHGSLSRDGRALLRAHLPGSQIPQAFT